MEDIQVQNPDGALLLSIFKFLKILSYIYYRFYMLMVSVGNADIAGLAALLLFTMMLGLNYFAFSGFFYVITGSKLKLTPDNNYLTIVLASIVFTVLYFILSWNGKSVEILSEYENEPKKDKIKGRVMIIGYMIFSLIMIMLSFYLMMKRNKGEL
jgi:hypothetical protein